MSGHDRLAAGTRHIALAVITVLVLASATASFAESYRGLFDWAGHHGLAGFWQDAFPLQVDTFIGVGELALFVALVDGWRTRDRGAASAVAGFGLIESVAGNVGHITSHAITGRATAAPLLPARLIDIAI